MTPEEKVKHLESEVQKLKEREKTLIHDLSIYKELFEHLNKQFEDMKRELIKR